MIKKIKESWALIQNYWKYKAPLKEGRVGYFKYGWTMVFLERVKKLEGGKAEISSLSRLSQRQNGLVDT